MNWTDVDLWIFCFGPDHFVSILIQIYQCITSVCDFKFVFFPNLTRLSCIWSPSSLCCAIRSPWSLCLTPPNHWSGRSRQRSWPRASNIPFMWVQNRLNPSHQLPKTGCSFPHRVNCILIPVAFVFVKYFKAGSFTEEVSHDMTACSYYSDPCLLDSNKQYQKSSTEDG